MLKKSQGKIGGSSEAEEANESSPQLWEKLNLAVVGPNATQWFEQFEPKNVMETVTSDYSMHEWSPLVTGALEDQIIPSMKIELDELGQLLRLEDSKLGKAILQTMDRLGVSHSLTPPVPLHLLGSYPAGKEANSSWSTDEEVAFSQHLRVYQNQDGATTAFWFVKLLVASNTMSKQIESSDSENRWLLKEDVPSYGDVSSKIHLPVFLKNLAWFCETPFPSTPIIQMSRDIAFGEIPEHCRPVPRFSIVENDLVWSHAVSLSSPSNIVTQSDIMPEAVWFGWTFTEDSIDHLEKILPIVTRGCTGAMSTVENGYTHFRDEAYPSDYDSVLANPCVQLDGYVRGENRLGGASWFPSTEIGEILAKTIEIQTDLENKQYSEQETFDTLFEVANQGIGIVQNAAINTAAYSFLLPDVANEGPGEKADLAERYLWLASTAGNTSEAWNAKNNLAALNILLGDYEAASGFLEEAIQSEWEDYHAEALAYLSLVKEKMGDSAAAEEYKNRCEQIGGFELPSWIKDQTGSQNSSSPNDHGSRPAFCSNCGSKFDDDSANFCQNCGTKRN